MRIALSVVFVVLAVILMACAFISFKSKKQIGKSVALLIISLVPPVIGNFFLIASDIEALSTVGCYIYFLGMDLVMFAVFRFMFDYCNITYHQKLIKWIVYVILIADAIQLILNLVWHHAFVMELKYENGAPYYTFTALGGQTFHRIVDYVILAGVMIVFLVKTIITPKVYSEKYLVIFLAMVAVAIWQSVNIFTKSIVNISMIGYGVFGVLVFVLTLFYRPLRLLDRMLGVIASKMPEAIFFFDTNGKCIWLNDNASNFLNLDDDDHLDTVSDLLNQKLKDYKKEGTDWENTVVTGEGEDFKCFVLQRHGVIDDRGRIVGSYLTIRDDTEVQKNLQRETYNAHHDQLTKILNRAGYDSAMENIDLPTCFLLLIDLDYFKDANDKYGHIAGDKVLIRVAETIKKNFREEDYVCRIGGDEFAVIIPNVKEDITKDIHRRVDQINDDLSTPYGGLPCITMSAGGAYGKDAENAYELYNNADHAMYKTKFGGKHGFSLYEKR